MKPIYFVIPLGAGLAYFLWGAAKASAAAYHQPAVSAPTDGGIVTAPVAPGGARARKYLSRINQASTGFTMAMSAARLLGAGKESLAVKGALLSLLGTMDVVGGMAANDTISGRITKLDMEEIQTAMKAAQATIDAA